jgi:glutathione S-transferase
MSQLKLAAVPGEERAVLRTTLTSPYGRKVRMTALVLGLEDRIEIRPADTLDAKDDLRDQNPLGKMPCLMADGMTLFDSRVIVEYLDTLAGGGQMIPAGGAERFRCLTRVALADGITDAALLMVYEGRFREASQMSARWLDHQKGKVTRGLTALAADLPDPSRTDAAGIAIACMLGYLDWRRPVEWRSDWPDLVRWLGTFSENEPAFDATRIPT